MGRRSQEQTQGVAAPTPAPSGRNGEPAPPTPTVAQAPPVILVVDGDGGLSYLLARYAKRGGFGFRQLRVPPHGTQAVPDAPATLWLPSVERLEAVQPRETGLVGDDSPVIVCTSAGEEGRAHGLGADFCVMHPLRYADFLAALRAVGYASVAGRQDVSRRRTGSEPDGGNGRPSGHRHE